MRLLPSCMSALSATVLGSLLIAGQSFAHSGQLPLRDGPVSGTLRLLAIRVAFDRDTLETTTGDGSFASAFEFDEPWAIDPLPHDSLYFDDQLRFLAHYYHRVSAERLTLEWEVWPRGSDACYQLDHPMWHYNYNMSSERSDEQLGELLRDSWAVADEDPELHLLDDTGQPRFDAFVIFHAGVGQDFGEDATPHDIPSAYFTSQELDTMQVQLHDGESVFQLPNCIIAPESENHEDFMHGLAGLLVLQFGHVIGLPNLYNSEDGTSVIGRWGLMDQGSANWRGLLPALPCAWSRVLLGWEETVVLERDTTVSIASLGSESDLPRVYEVPLNDHEYLLLECRLRDRDGDNLTWGRDREGREAILDSLYDVSFSGDTTGVLVEVGDLDYDLPGSGLLIWHVDTRATSASHIATNSVNDNPELRGVDLEEGDGVQDIGVEYSLLNSRNGLALGSFYDPWFLENKEWEGINSHLDEVSFGYDSWPDSGTNDGILTGVRITPNSLAGDTMSFSVQWDLRPAWHNRQVSLAGELSSQLFSLADSLQLLCVTDETDGLYGSLLAGSGLALYDAGNGLQTPLPGAGSSLDFLRHLSLNDSDYLFSCNGSELGRWGLQPVDDSLRFVLEDAVDLGAEVRAIQPGHTSQTSSGGALFLVVDGEFLRMDALDFSERTTLSWGIADEVSVELCGAADTSEQPALLVRGAPNLLLIGGANQALELGRALSSEARLLGWNAFGDSEDAATVILADQGHLWLFRNDQLLRELDLTGDPLPVQYGGDAALELLVQDGHTMSVYSQSGVLLDEIWLEELPLQSLSGSAGKAMLLAQSESALGVLDENGLRSTWPRIMSEQAATQTAFAFEQEDGAGWYGCVTETGVLHGWYLPEAAGLVYAQAGADANNSMRPASYGVLTTSGVDPSTERQVVLWPNPMAERVQLRFQRSGPLAVQLRVYDTAGVIRMEQSTTLQTSAGPWCEWSLPVTQLAPGAYYFLVEATGPEGSFKQSIKCAVVR